MPSIEYALPSGEELAETNAGFRFLFKKGQLQSGAMLFLQWCLAPQVAKYLREKEVFRAKVFLCVRNSHGGEHRYIFPLESPQELIEFHCSGEHTLSGVIVWGDGLRIASERFLKERDRHRYWCDAKDMEHISENMHQCYWFGHAELSVSVAEGFFAPEMSPAHSWYVNLWFGQPAWDECEIRRRKWIAYSIQTLVLALWIPFVFITRGIYALWLSVMLLRKEVPWRALVHPFLYQMKDLRNQSEDRWEKVSGISLRLPIVQVALIGISLGIPVWITGDAATLVDVVLTYAGLVASVLVVSFALDKGIDAWLSRYMEEQKERDRLAWLQRMYSDELLCTTAPADGTLRTKRQGLKNTAVLWYHDLKTRVCRPTAQH